MDIEPEPTISWDVFESCHDNEDTKCFTRCMGKNSLYDVQNIGIIMPRGPVFQCPEVNTLQSEDNIVISADETITILSQKAASHEATINLGSTIEALCFRPDGKMVVAADASGVIHLISVRTGKVMFSHEVVDPKNIRHCSKSISKEPQKLFCSVTCSRDSENGYETFFIGIGFTHSRFIVFSNVKLLLLEKAYEAGDVEAFRSTQLEMKRMEYDASAVHGPSMKSFLAVDTGFCQKFRTTGNGVVALWTQDTNPFILEQNSSAFVVESQSDLSCYGGGEIVKLFHLSHHIYSLDSKGIICLRHMNSFSLIRSWENLGIQDFTITDSGVVDGKVSAKLYAIISNEATKELKLCVFQLPEMVPCFTCSCAGKSFCRLALGPPSLEEVIYVDADISSESCLRIHCVSEAAPEDRLIRLLSKRRFEEAEKFATLYNLDAQQVHQQKATYIANAIVELKENSLLNDMFMELMSCLNKLNDGAFVAEICMETVIPDVRMNYKLLALGRSRLDNALHAQNGHSSRNHLSEVENNVLFRINDRIDRLVTFHIVYGYSQEDGTDWIRFCSTELPIELTQLLATGNISAAANVLLRHKATLLNFLESPGQTSDDDASHTEKRLEAFLEHIPGTVDVDDIACWLEDSLLPTLLPRISCALKVLAVWLHNRAESYEGSNPFAWPENGLRMASVIYNFQNNMSGLESMKSQVCGTSQIFKSTSVEVARLRSLVSRLQSLLQLKQKYKCNVSLTEFIEETTTTLTYRMLDRVMVPELIPSTLQNTVRPYMKEHGLSEEEVLLGYIEDLLSRFRDHSWSLGESLRERKTVAILQCVTDSQVFLEAIVKLAKRASVPWSDDVDSLVDKGIGITESSGMQEDSGDAENSAQFLAKRQAILKELRYCRHVVQLPTVLADYGLTNVNVGNTSSHKQIIRFLIRQGTRAALDQARHFCQTFTTVSTIDFYRFRLFHLLNYGKEQECIDLLLEVESEDQQLAMCLVKRMIGLAEIKLDDKDSNGEERAKFCNVAIMMVEHAVRKLKNGTDAKGDFLCFFEESLSVLKSVMELQVQCGEYVSVDEFMDKSFRESLLARKIKQHSSSNQVGLDCDTTKTENSSSSSSGALQSFSSVFLDHAVADSSRLLDGNLRDLTAERDKTPVFTSLGHVLNVGRILGIPTEQLRSWMALCAVRNGEGRILTAVHLCRDLLRIFPTEESANAVLGVVAEAIKHLSMASRDFMKISSNVLSVAAEAVMFCEPKKMAEGMVMCMFLTLCNELIRVTDDHEEIFLRKGASTSKDPFSNVAALFPWMEDSGGLMVQTEQVLPLFVKIMELLFKDGKGISSSTHQNLEHVESNLMELRSFVLQMTSILQEARQPQLALLWSISCISISLRSVANQCSSAKNEEARVKDDAIFKQMITAIEELNKIMPAYVNDFIKKVLSTKTVDVDLVIGLLTLLPITDAQKLLLSEMNKASNNSKKVMCIAQAGVATLRLHSMDAEVGKFQHLFLDARWGELLRPLKIPFDQAYSASKNNKTSTLKKLVHHPEASGQMIWEFCMDYDLNATSSLLEFARVLLSDPSCLIAERDRKHSEGVLISIDSSKSPSFGIQHMAWGDGKLKQTTGMPQEEPDCGRPWGCLQKEMAFVMGKVSEKGELSQQLVRILRSETSPYYYKRAKFILNLIAECGQLQSSVDVKKGLELIECLQFLRRSSAISEYERQCWNLAGTSVTCKLPEISIQRLPLHPLLFGDSSSAWKILIQELNEKSVTRLVPIARILSLSVDKLFVTAADNFIRNRMDSNNRLALSIQQLSTVSTLTQEVKDLRMATALAKKIAELLPISEQKVKAYEWCTDLAAKWRASVSEEDREHETVVNAHRNLRSYFYRVSVELVLHKHNLLTENTSVLTASPEKLTMLLYQHPSIVKRYFKPHAESYPDILEATSAIAIIYSLSISKLRMSISKEWLLAAGNKDQNGDEDSTIDLQNMKAASIINLDSESSSAMTSDQIRLLFVLSHVPTRQAAKFVLGFAFDRKDPRISDGCRVQALQCALHLFDDDVIEELTKETVPYIRETLRILVCLTELDSIGFTISGAKLKGRKKDEIARSIYAIPQFRHDPRAMRVAAELCREFCSWCPNTWQALLQQLVALRQISYLRQLLPNICCHASISSLPCLATVWQSCVTFPLTAMTSPLNAEDVKAAISSYHFLLSCPVLLQINLIGVARHFCAIELPLFALGCLLVEPFPDESSRKLAIANYDAIQEQLAEYPSIPCHKQIIEVLRTCKNEANAAEN